MRPRIRKLLLTAHIISSVGWLGALAGFLALSATSVLSPNPEMVRSTSVAMGLVAWFVILPLSIATLLTGLVQSLGTSWGLFRHYWVLAKLLLTTLATAILVLKLTPIGFLADAATAATFSPDEFSGLRNSILLHAVGGLLVLLVTSGLAVYKPRGVTPYGMRIQRESSETTCPESVYRTPRWVTVFGVLILALIVMTGAMLLAGGHGPGAHAS